jgi:hypothetical protein
MIMIDVNFYYTMDFYPDIDGQPFILIVRTSKNENLKSKLPPISKLVSIYREVTNEPEYFPETISMSNYQMNEKDAKDTEY